MRSVGWGSTHATRHPTARKLTFPQPSLPGAQRPPLTNQTGRFRSGNLPFSCPDARLAMRRRRTPAKRIAGTIHAQYEYKVVPAPRKGLKAQGRSSHAEARFSHATATAYERDGGRRAGSYQRAETLPCDERQGLKPGQPDGLSRSAGVSPAPAPEEEAPVNPRPRDKNRSREPPEPPRAADEEFTSYSPKITRPSPTPRPKSRRPETASDVHAPDADDSDPNARDLRPNPGPAPARGSTPPAPAPNALCTARCCATRLIGRQLGRAQPHGKMAFA